MRMFHKLSKFDTVTRVEKGHLPTNETNMLARVFAIVVKMKIRKLFLLSDSPWGSTFLKVWCPYASFSSFRLRPSYTAKRQFSPRKERRIISCEIIRTWHERKWGIDSEIYSTIGFPRRINIHRKESDVPIYRIIFEWKSWTKKTLLTCDISPKGLKSSRRSASVHENARLRTKSRAVCKIVSFVGSFGASRSGAGELTSFRSTFQR